MKLNKLAFISILLFSLLSSCKPGVKGDETIVLIETDLGDIKVKLYNETPKHRDNFIKLVQEGFYDNLLFHRVINEFMIQGGDPKSKDADANAMLGDGDVDYQIPAEFRFPQYYHKKGALAAAREGDRENPHRHSSGCQFYIVTGKIFSDRDLNDIEAKRDEDAIHKVVMQLFQENEKNFLELEKSDDMMALQVYMDSLRTEARKIYEKGTPFRFPKEVRETYTTIGGSPWLDDAYTVFGEVTEGMDVVEKIQRVRTNRADRPNEDIKMTMKIVKQ